MYYKLHNVLFVCLHNKNVLCDCLPENEGTPAALPVLVVRLLVLVVERLPHPVQLDHQRDLVA